MNLRPELLLHPTLPRPLHGTVPREIKGDAWWNRERKLAYARADYRCQACGVHKSEAEYHQWVEAHEAFDIDYSLGTMTFVEVVALCHACHNFIHSERMENLADKGKFPEWKRQRILKRGHSLLYAAGLEFELEPVCHVPWRKWRMVMDGQSYAGKFPTLEDWMKFYED